MVFSLNHRVFLLNTFQSTERLDFLVLRGFMFQSDFTSIGTKSPEQRRQITGASPFLSSRSVPAESSTKTRLKTSTRSSSHKEVCARCFVFPPCFSQAIIDYYIRIDYFKLKAQCLCETEERSSLYSGSLEFLTIGSHHYAKILPEEEQRKHQEALIYLCGEKKGRPANIMAQHRGNNDKTLSSKHTVLPSHHEPAFFEVAKKKLQKYKKKKKNHCFEPFSCLQQPPLPASCNHRRCSETPCLLSPQMRQHTRTSCSMLSTQITTAL